ncbi:MAG TPA: ABC transporter ATP-binding protein [Verrucomicrobiae bacterium]|nr:ABC transporter ATP-binding protein [Verrucomicrobiae bacterium]
MSDAIIKVSNLGKCYRIQHQAERQRYIALRDVIAEKAKGFFRREKKVESRTGSASSPLSAPHSARSSSEEFWALKDVSFEVKRGEVVGIIGRNGAGKSTLLKILSRITEPTTGRVELNGRVASLLEVGTGFHPELTGRENIFLNGAILGMTRAEIRKKFDEIVAFAEVEKFLDTPVKRYSSGMYVRLAFAVAAHLEPEILIVDEVLAVGDAEFQKKCLGKMQDVASGGRTVLFVSHNMAAVRNLCSKGIYLKNGTVRLLGSIDETIDGYLASGTQRQVSKPISKNGVELAEVKLCAAGSKTALNTTVFGVDCEFRIKVIGNSSNTKVTPVLRIHNSAGVLISSICGPEEGLDFSPIRGSRDWVILLPALQLFPGLYTVSFQLFGNEPDPFLEALDVLEFHVEAAFVQGASKAYRADHGLIRLCSGISDQGESK